MKTFLEYLLRILLIVVFASAAYLLLSHLCRRDTPPQIKEVGVPDTLIVWDTITIEKPISVTSKVRDSVRFAVPKVQTDTVHDTVYVYLPQQDIVWTDSLCSVYAHGINPVIDSVIHFLPTKTIIPKPNPKRWGIGIQAGYGASEDGLSPYIGIGVTYSLIRF